MYPANISGNSLWAPPNPWCASLPADAATPRGKVLVCLALHEQARVALEDDGGVYGVDGAVAVCIRRVLAGQRID